MGSDELRVPTHPVAVDIYRAGAVRERVELFVHGDTRTRTSIATEIAALLEGENDFVPVREPDAPGGARIALVGKHAILWVAVPLAAAAGGGPAGDAVPDDVPFEPSEVLSLYDHRHDVRVELDGAEPLIGHVLYSSPADRPRLIDHLNQTVRFLRVWTTEALYLVHKHHIVRVLELG